MGLDVQVGVKDAKFRSGLAQIRNQARQFSGSITGMLAGAFSIAGITAFAGKMREVQKEAQRLGTTAETVQRIGAAAKRGDVDFDTLARSINKVTLEATRAARGGAEQSKLFRTLGIDAAKFVGMGLDQKILVLSQAFARSRTSGMGTAAMLELLGERGQEIIPLLAQGPGQLSATMRDATVQTNGTVAAFANLDRQIQKIKGTGAKFLSVIIGGVQKGAGAVGSLLNNDFQDAAEQDMQNEQTRRKAAGEPEMGFVERRAFVVSRLRQLRIDAMNDAADDAAKGDDKNAPPTPANDFTKDAAAAQMTALRKQIADEQNRNRADALTGEARIKELTEQRLALEGRINDSAVEGLEAKKEALSLDKEIQQAQAKLNKDVETAQKAEAGVLEKRYLAKASPAEQKKYLQDKQKRLMGESDEAAAAGDSVKSIQKRTEAESVQDEIDGLPKRDKGRVTVAVDSLQRVGGGGGIAAGDQAVRQRDKTNDLLAQIKNLLAQNATVQVRDVADGDY